MVNESYAKAAEVIEGFWGRFGVPVFREGSVPRGFERPCIVFSHAMGSCFAEMNESAALVNFAESEANRLIGRIAAAIPEEGKILPIGLNDGVAWLNRATTFVKRRRGTDNLAVVYEVGYTVGVYC